MEEAASLRSLIGSGRKKLKESKLQAKLAKVRPIRQVVEKHHSFGASSTKESVRARHLNRLYCAMRREQTGRKFPLYRRDSPGFASLLRLASKLFKLESEAGMRIRDAVWIRAHFECYGPEAYVNRLNSHCSSELYQRYRAGLHCKRIVISKTGQLRLEKSLLRQMCSSWGRTRSDILRLMPSVFPLLRRVHARKAVQL